MNTEANKLLKQLDADFDATAEMGTLSVAQQQMVEIAKAMSTNARIIILDEPTAALTRSESEKLYTLVDKLKADGVPLSSFLTVLRICIVWQAELLYSVIPSTLELTM